jgi:hypothetical protein
MVVERAAAADQVGLSHHLDHRRPSSREKSSALPWRALMPANHVAVR